MARVAQVDRAFRSIKTMDLKVRPIHHHLEDRVAAIADCSGSGGIVQGMTSNFETDNPG